MPEEGQPFLLPPRENYKSVLISYDTVVIVITFGLTLLFSKLPPFVRPFKLGDPDISYPHKADFVPALWVFLFAGLAPPIVFLAVTRRLVKSLTLYQQYLVGWGLTNVVTECIKIMAGRLRPDFLDRCQPDANLVCTGAESTVTDGRKSFFSGHSSNAFYVVGYLVVWMLIEGYAILGLRGTRRQSLGIVAFFSIVPLLLSSYVAISRTQQYVHHPSDVAIGSAFGFIMAILIHYVYKSYMNKTE